MKKQKIIKYISIILILLLSFGMLTGCKKKTQEPQTEISSSNENENHTNQDASSSETNSSNGGVSSAETDNQNKEDSSENDTNSHNSMEDEEALLNEDGYYYTKEDVSLYLHTYGHLPDNYITKKEAKKLGWSGGTPERFKEGAAIGGDKYGNYEELLPEGKTYYECDIDTNGKKKRGAKRIVWSDDGYIYYTPDHYETFELLYEGD